MNSHLLQLRIWMEKHAVYPRSKLAVVTCYVLAIDVLLFALQQLSRTLGRSFGTSLGGWVTFLSAVVTWLPKDLLRDRRSRDTSLGMAGMSLTS